MRLNQEAYNRLMQLKEGAPDGRVHPQAVVSDAEDETSPLHRYFEWNDDKAAHEYRVQQARHLLRVVVHVLEPQHGKPVTTRVFTRLHDENGYRPMVDVLSAEDTRQRMLETALMDLERVRKKYSDLEELADVFRALERVAA